MMISHILIYTYLNDDESEDDRLFRGWCTIGIWCFIVLIHFSYFIYMGLKGMKEFFVKTCKKKKKKK